MAYKVNTLPSKLLLIVLCWPMSLMAAWSGVSLSLGDETIPITNGSQQALALTPFSLKLEIEDKTAQGLRVGAGIAKVGIGVDGSSIHSEIAGDSVGLYLYFPYQFNASIGLISRLSLTKTDTTSNLDPILQVDYFTKELSLALMLKWQNIRIVPSINARSIMGDYQDEANHQSFSFKQQQTVYKQLFIDYFIEQNSFVRFTVNEHFESTFRISFATIY